MMKQNHQTGFTLIELSIVLVVIGLIVGGVLVGKDLIEAAKIRSVVTAVEQLQTSANVYKLKYLALPGDDPSATTIWGTNPDGCVAYHYGIPLIPGMTPRRQTCNGNGDGRIFPSIPNGQADNWEETYLFYQHLADAELIPGIYTGEPTTDILSNTQWGITPGINMPALKQENMVLIALYSFDPSGNNPVMWGSNLGNSLITYCRIRNNALVPCYFTTAESPAIDQKLDDGRPGTGNVTCFRNTGCATTTNSATAVYDTTRSDKVGALTFSKVHPAEARAGVENGGHADSTWSCVKGLQTGRGSVAMRAEYGSTGLTVCLEGEATP